MAVKDMPCAVAGCNKHAHARFGLGGDPLCASHYSIRRQQSFIRPKRPAGGSSGCRRGRPKADNPKSSHPLYGVWHGILRRRKSGKSAIYYAHIQVCDRWRNDFWAFVADMGPKPTPAHTLDRYPNPFGDYEPSNCRWATRREQMHNRRDNHRITLNGRTQIMSDWAREIGLSPSTIHYRQRHGWSVEAAITAPPVPGVSLRRRAANPSI